MFKTPIKSTPWSPDDVMEKCSEMRDENSGCLVINIKANREITKR